MITSVLLPAFALMVLLALINGRSTGTRSLTLPYDSRNTCVSTWSPWRGTPPTITTPACSLASVSGTTFSSPSDSTTASPAPRSADLNSAKAWARVTGTSLNSEMVPLTRGSTTMGRSRIVAIARAAASASMLGKSMV